jgi:DHA1 family tetracycline resistance protein-like MFS transporter
MPPAEATSRSATGALFVTVMIDLIGFGIVLPLLPGYAARFAVSETAIGLLVGSFSLMQFLFAPWWGRLSDRIGRRPVILIGLAGSALSYLLFAVAGSFWILLLSRVLAGGMGATVNVTQAYLADVTPVERRAKAMGLLGAAFGLGFVLGPAIAGLTVRWGTRAPGLVAAGISLASFCLAWIRLPETRVHRPLETLPPASDWGRLAAPFGVLFLLVLAFTLMHVVFPLYSQRTLQFDQSHTAYFFVLLGLVSALVQGLLIGGLSRRFSEHTLMVAGGGLLSLGLALIPFAQRTAPSEGTSLPGLLAAIVLIAVGSGLAMPSITGYVSRITPPSRQGAALGTLQSIGSVARIAGPTASGFLTELTGERTAFLAGAGIALVGMLLALLARSQGSTGATDS